MTATVQDCENILINSPYFETWWTNYPVNLYSLVLEVTHNGGEKELITLDQTNLSNQAPYEYTHSAQEGVYSFKLIRTEIATGNFTEDFQCLFNECDLACELAENLSTGCETTHRLITFLRAINLCNQCDCKYANIAYAALTRHKTISPLKNNSDDCGCN